MFQPTIAQNHSFWVRLSLSPHQMYSQNPSILHGMHCQYEICNIWSGGHVEVERETVMGVVGFRYVDALQQNELFDLCEDDFSSFVDDDYQHGDHAITSVSVNLFPLVMYHSCYNCYSQNSLWIRDSKKTSNWILPDWFVNYPKDNYFLFFLVSYCRSSNPSWTSIMGRVKWCQQLIGCLENGGLLQQLSLPQVHLMKECRWLEGHVVHMFFCGPSRTQSILG